MPITKNCHGCKWLDAYGGNPSDEGYCCHVERSKQGKAHRKHLQEQQREYALGRKEMPSIKCRTPDMKRCELYEAGDFATRYQAM